MIGNNFLDIMMHEQFTGHQSYVLLCTETILSNPPVVHPKSSCDVHLLRSPCIIVCTSPLFSVLKSIKFFLLHQILSGVSHSSWDFINCIDEFSTDFFFSFMSNKSLLITQLLNASNLKFTPMSQGLND